jgi:hypothetical protein
MKCRELVLPGATAVMVAVASWPMAGQARRGADSTAAPASWTAPRTAWGDPDLQGVWRSEGGVTFERSLEYEGRERLTEAEMAQRQKRAEERQAVALAGKATNRGFRAQENYNSIFNTSAEKPKINPRTSAITDPPNGRLPAWTLEQVKRWDEREAATRGRGEGESWEDVNVGGRCIADLSVAKVPAWGLGFGGENTAYGGRDAKGENLNITNGDGIDPGAATGGARRILQAPGYVVILHEEQGEYFIIPLDKRPAPSPAKIRQLRGVQRGHWDGNTLVIEHTNVRYFYPLIPNAGFPLYPGTGETLKVTERFTRVGPDKMEWSYTVEDPAVYVRPYSVLHGLGRDDAYKMAPDLCHENNRDMGGLLANARADDQLSLENGALSVEMRKPRVEKLRKEAQDAAKSRSSKRP